MQQFSLTNGLTNMLFNGAFELQVEGVPEFWDVSELNGSTSYSISREGIRVVVGSGLFRAITQDRTASGSPLDFPIPYEGGLQETIAAGYAVERETFIARGSTYTFSADVTVHSGQVLFGVSPTNALAPTSQASVLLGVGDKQRIHLSFTQVFSDSGQFKIIVAGRPSAELTINKVMLAPGSYEALPYTGDPFAQVFPQGAIVMAMGEACPTGFRPLDEDTQPLAEWVEDEPGILAKRGNYPRSGDQLAGATTHTKDTPGMDLVRRDSREFEGTEGRLFVEFANSVDNVEAGGPDPRAFTVNSQNAPVDVSENHSHELSREGLRPASYGLQFCKRV